MTVPPGSLLGADALGDARARLEAAVGPAKVVAGWATVELDRAAEEVAGVFPGAAAYRAVPAPDEGVLGARTRILRYGEDREILLLEPAREGRLAAALARYGEGTIALYLLADAGAPARARRAGFVLTSAGRGPYGPERLVIAGPRYGPFLILAGLA